MSKVRRFGLTVCVVVALSSGGTAVAAPRDNRGSDQIGKIKNVVVRILEDVASRLGFPPG